VTEPVLAIEGLTVDLPAGADRPCALEGLDLTVGRGEVVCLVGESGSGKSVTAQAVMGLLPPGRLIASDGTIRYGGQDLLTLPLAQMRRLRGARISMIFQEPMAALNPVTTVGHQIAEAICAHEPMRRSALHARIEALLAQVGLPDPPLLRRAYPHNLSGGQRQRVMIAMALALSPDLLIADEPTTALDVTTQMQILELLKALQRQRHMAVLFITHDFGVVAEIADRVAVLRQGRKVEEGLTREVLTAPRHPYTQALIAAVPRLSATQGGVVDQDAPVVLRTEALNKTYGLSRSLFRPTRQVRAVNGVSLSIRRGETLGIVGESGSGKTTLARLIVRLFRPDSGAIDFHGTDLAPLGRAALRPYRRRIQMVFQDPFGSLNPRWTVGDIIAAGPVAQGMPRRAALERAAGLLELVGLELSAMRRFPHEFSGGQRQRIGIARALAVEPELLVADEPVSALDVSVQAQVLRLLDSIRHRLHLTMLLITHDLRVAAQVCDRIAVMQKGEVVEYGPTAELFLRPRNAYTQQLIGSIPGRDWLEAAPPPEVAAQSERA
jgi:peptide/nickel transport system ATP-binding protein